MTGIRKGEVIGQTQQESAFTPSPQEIPRYLWFRAPAFSRNRTNLRRYGVTVMDIAGNALYKTSFKTKQIIDLKSLSSGIYFIRINNADATVVKKFIKQ